MQDLEAIVRSLMEDQGKLAVTCIDSQRPPGTTTGTTGSAGPGGPGAPYDAPAPPPPPVGAPLTQPIPVALNLLKLGFNLVGQRWPLFCHRLLVKVVKPLSYLSTISGFAPGRCRLCQHLQMCWTLFLHIFLANDLG